MTLLALLLAALPRIQDADDPPLGTWEGILKVGEADLKLRLRVERGENGALEGKLDVPAQGAVGQPLDECAYADGRLTFSFKASGFRYEGKRAADGKSFEGTFAQGGRTFPLTFRRTSKSAAGPRRPQTPKPPYPYVVRETAIDSVAGVRLAGTLTVPEGDGPHPAVVLVSGSGPQDRDETIFGHKPFHVLADHLTRKGVAVLRYDDRGSFRSTGNFAAATTEDFASDAAAAVTWLRSRSEIDPDRIGVAGHSEGGLIAPMVAANDPRLAFIVLLAGPGVIGHEVLSRQSVLISRASGADPIAVAINQAVQKRIFETIRKAKDVAAAREGVRDILGKAMPPAQVERQVAMTTSPWFRFFLSYDPRPTLARVKCPVLAVNGGKDLQIDPKQNLPPIEKALRDAGNSNVTARELKGLNHLFQTCRTGLVAEYGEIEQTFAPEALEVVSSWILERIR